MRGSRPHQVLLDEVNPVWTPERWERLRQGLHRQGLLQRRPHTPGEYKLSKHTALTRPRPKQKSRGDVAYDDYIANSPNSYEAMLVCSQRKAIGKRHARRKMRRASRQAQRR